MIKRLVLTAALLCASALPTVAQVSVANPAGRSVVQEGKADGLTVGGAVLPTILGGKAPLASPVFTGVVTVPRLVVSGSGSTGDISAMTVGGSTIPALLDTKAPLASPVFTGQITVPSLVLTGTGSTGDISAMTVGGSTIPSLLGARAPLASPTFTGVVTAPRLALTATGSTGDISAMTVGGSTIPNLLGAKAPLESPVFTGAVTVPRLTVSGTGSTGDISGMTVGGSTIPTLLSAKAPINGPVFTGSATTPRLVITGTGSTGDISGMSATPNATAEPGTISRYLLAPTTAGRAAVEQGAADSLTVGGSDLATSLGAKAPLASPVFTGTATTQRLAITGTGSTGDVSGMTVTPSGTAPTGTLARYTLSATTAGRAAVEQGTADGLTVDGSSLTAALAAKAPLSGPIFTAPIKIRGASGTNRLTWFTTGDSLRMTFGVTDTAESGGNAGSDPALFIYSDTGSFLGAPLTISRATGRVTLSSGLTAKNLVLSEAGSTGDVSGMSATPASGGVSRTLAQLLSTQIYAINYGVVPGAPDSGPALRRAIVDAQAVAGRVILPPGVINVCGGTDPEALLRIELFMDLVGSSQKSRIEPCANAGNRAVLLVKPLVDNGGIRGAVLKDFSIGIPGVARPYGGDGIKIDTTNKNGFVAKLLVENVGISSRGSGFYAVNHVNVNTVDANGGQVTGNLTGGLFGSTFRDSDFIGGMRFQLTGDSNNIERNIIAGPNEGIYYQAIGGAATHRIVGNNVTATGDTIVIDGGQQVYILENQLEAVGTYTGSRTNPAVITVIGAISVDVRNNNINAYTRSDAVAALGGSRGVSVNWNTVNYAAGKYLFRAVSSPDNVVGRQLYEAVGGALITGQSRVLVDAASPTVGVWQQLPTSNGWVSGTDASFHQGLWWMPTPDGTVRLSGTIKGGTTTPGTVVATLPVGYRPTARALRFPSMVYTANVVNGTAWGTGIYILDAGGSITIQALPTLSPSDSFLQFDSTSFSVSR